MSLMQQGSHVAINKVMKIPADRAIVKSAWRFIKRYEREAHVLIRMWAEWGNFVLGKKNAIRMPSNAAGLTMYHSSMKLK